MAGAVAVIVLCRIACPANIYPGNSLQIKSIQSCPKDNMRKAEALETRDDDLVVLYTGVLGSSASYRVFA